MRKADTIEVEVNSLQTAVAVDEVQLTGAVRDVLQGELRSYHFWLRSVAAEPHKIYRKRSWAFWQFTTTGSVPGIDGKVDRNIYNGTRGDWDGVLKWLEASR